MRGTPTTVSDFLYLASQSPRRRQLLEQLGVRVELLLPDADEDAEALEATRPGEAPAAYVKDDRDAARMLSELAGRTHRVLTAVAVQAGRKRLQALSTSRVTFAPMTPAQIRAYVASGEPQGKAGAYAIQGLAAAHVSHLSGSYSGIMGLPLHETAGLLRAAGVRLAGVP